LLHWPSPSRGQRKNARITNESMRQLAATTLPEARLLKD